MSDFETRYATHEQMSGFPPLTKPIPVEVTDGTAGLGCRICIARNGLRSRDVGSLPQTHEEFRLHMRQFHNREATF